MSPLFSSAYFSPIRWQSVCRRLAHPLVIGAGLLFGLWSWNWPLAVAIASGTTATITVYLYQVGRLHVSWFHRFDTFAEMDAIVRDQSIWQARLENLNHRLRGILTRFWAQCRQPTNQALTIALFSGGLLAIIVATAGAVYRDLHSLSLLWAMGLQLLTAGLIGYLFWQQTSDASTPSKALTSAKDGGVDPTELIETAITVDRLWADLVSQDTSVRLVAIYRSINWVQSLGYRHDDGPAQGPAQGTRAIALNAVMGMDAQKLTACFRVMLAHESNPNVQKALRDGLMTLQNV
ncbi:MAG: hypothetical protein AAGD25_12445 [Cyanobacteria bacterium P01_F01_bin.150]